jgi:hypothetical protein
MKSNGCTFTRVGDGVRNEGPIDGDAYRVQCRGFYASGATYCFDVPVAEVAENHARGKHDHLDADGRLVHCPECHGRIVPTPQVGQRWTQRNGTREIVLVRGNDKGSQWAYVTVIAARSKLNPRREAARASRGGCYITSSHLPKTYRIAVEDAATVSRRVAQIVNRAVTA